VRIRRTHYILLTVLIIFIVKAGYAYIQVRDLQTYCRIFYNIEPEDGFIEPDRALWIAITFSFSFNIEEVSIFLDAYPQMNLVVPTYGVEIIQKRLPGSFEGGLVSVKVDAQTGFIKDISYGKYFLNPYDH
jgi:hypothetical protein